MVYALLDWISHTSYWGVPLDIVAHLLIGAILYLVARRVTGSASRALALVFAAAIAKELFDVGVVMRNQFYLEPIKDIAVSIAVPLMAFFSKSQAPKLREK